MGALLEPLAQQGGARMALADEFGQTSWEEFDQRVDRLIHSLRGAGLGTGDTFAVLSGNRREYMEAMAAATQAGMRVVPINWHWVGEEVAYVLENSDAKAFIADTRFCHVAADALERGGGERLQLIAAVGGNAPDGFDDYEALLAAAPSGDPGDPSMGGPMFYTSGTTGRPKGVVSTSLPQGAPIEIAKLMSASVTGSLGLPESGITLLVGPLYHSAQWAFSFLPLLAGSAVVMRHKFDASETLELVDRYGVTNLHLVPTQFVRLLRLGNEQKQSFSGSSLQAVWHGAAPCPPEVKRQMIDWWGPVIHEYYGATEGAIVSTIRADEWLEHPGSLGRLLDTVEIRVVDEQGRDVNPGEEGQLYFKNKLGMDFEYHKDPDKTSSAHLEAGVYTFGDVGYVDENGFLYMSDRKIDMIISGGVNIYPSEIEGVLAAHPAVADAAVFGVPNDEFGEEVKAAVELAAGQTASDELAHDLSQYCREHLAGYKVPRSFDFEEALPRHPTGKLYKRLLRDRYWAETGRKI